MTDHMEDFREPHFCLLLCEKKTFSLIMAIITNTERFYM